VKLLKNIKLYASTKNQLINLVYLTSNGFVCTSQQQSVRKLQVRVTVVVNC
jgi:hypothetical protein